MLCDRCHSKPAVMHLMRVVDGKMMQVHLCADCAAEFGLKPPDELGVDPGDLAEAMRRLEALGREMARRVEEAAEQKELEDGGEEKPGDDGDDHGGGDGGEDADALDFELHGGGEMVDADAGGEEERQRRKPLRRGAGGGSGGAAAGRCPVCGSRASTSGKIHAMGCPACYEMLEKQANWSALGLRPYGGVVPAAAGAEARRAVELSRLEWSLKEKVAAERYEESARVRDRITALRRAEGPELEGLLEAADAEAEARAEAALAGLRPTPGSVANRAGVIRVRLQLRRNLADERFATGTTATVEGVEMLKKRIPAALTRLSPTGRMDAMKMLADYYPELLKQRPSERVACAWERGGDFELAPEGKGAGRGGGGRAARKASGVPAINIGLFDGAHVSLYADAAPSEAKVALEGLLAADAALGAFGLRWAFSPRLGHLARNLARCGTGLDVRVLLHLPALRAMGHIEAANDALEQLGLALEPLREVAEVPAKGSTDMLPFYWLGVPDRFFAGMPMPMDDGRNEASLLADTLAAANALSRSDRMLMQKLDRTWAQDRYLRAMSFFVAARRMGHFEALGALSDLRMGEELGLDSGPFAIRHDAVLSPSALYERLLAIAPARLAAPLSVSVPKTMNILDPYPQALLEAVLRVRATLFDDFFLNDVRSAPAPSADAPDVIPASAPKSCAAARRRPSSRKPKGPTP